MLRYGIHLCKTLPTLHLEAKGRFPNATNLAESLVDLDDMFSQVPLCFRLLSAP